MYVSKGLQGGQAGYKLEVYENLKNLHMPQALHLKLFKQH